MNPFPDDPECCDIEANALLLSEINDEIDCLSQLISYKDDTPVTDRYTLKRLGELCKERNKIVWQENYECGVLWYKGKPVEVRE